MNFRNIKNQILTFDNYIYKKFEVIVGKTSDDTTKNLYSIFRFAAISTIFVLLLNLLLRIEAFGLGKWKLGEFGDFFGGVLNPILTFLMFVGLIITIVMQKSELVLARNEFERTANALNEQSVSSKQQVIENTFFNLLKLQSDIVESLKFNDGILCCALNVNDDDTTGRAVFSSIISWMTDSKNKDRSLSNYESFQETENHVIGHYFRALYQVLKFINDSDITDKEKLRYSRLMRAQLSSDELTLLCFNCICPNVDEGQFRALLIEFKMLEHLQLTSAAEEDYFFLSSRGGYMKKCDLLKYIEFDAQGKAKRSAFGSNPTANKELHSYNKSNQSDAA